MFEGSGRFNEYVGGYSDWLCQRRKQEPAQVAPAKKAMAPKPRPKSSANKLGYKEQRELEALPAIIERLEVEQEALQGRMAQPDFYKQESGAIAEAKERLERIEAELLGAYDRWEALEAGE